MQAQRLNKSDLSRWRSLCTAEALGGLNATGAYLDAGRWSGSQRLRPRGCSVERKHPVATTAAAPAAETASPAADSAAANRAGRRSARSHASGRHTADGRARHRRRLRHQPRRTAGAGAHLAGRSSVHGRHRCSPRHARHRRRHRRQALGKGERPRARRHALRYADAARRRRALSYPDSRSRRTAQATKKKDAVKIGAPAAGGAIIGAIVGGKKGAAIGTAAAAAPGPRSCCPRAAKKCSLPKGSALTLRLSEPVTISVKR